jgi:hypothetical protein
MPVDEYFVANERFFLCADEWSDNGDPSDPGDCDCEDDDEEQE